MRILAPVHLRWTRTIRVSRRVNCWRRPVECTDHFYVTLLHYPRRWLAGVSREYVHIQYTNTCVCECRVRAASIFPIYDEIARPAKSTGLRNFSSYVPVIPISVLMAAIIERLIRDHLQVRRYWWEIYTYNDYPANNNKIITSPPSRWLVKFL